MTDLHLGIITLYTELQGNTIPFINGTIVLQDDSDGKGPYIKAWNYSKPEPTLEQVISASTSDAALAYVANLEAQAANLVSNTANKLPPIPPIPNMTINTSNVAQPISTGTQTI